MEHLMLDLETMGTESTSAIVSIGAVMFDPESNKLGEAIHIPISLKSAMTCGLKINPDTILWWLKQSENARGSTFTDGAHELHDGLGIFSEWMGKQHDKAKIKIWGNGSDFDNVILANAYQSQGYQLPWKFYNNRCFRTLKNMVLLDEQAQKTIVVPTREGTHHNAMDDAIYQAKFACELSRLFKTRLK